MFISFYFTTRYSNNFYQMCVARLREKNDPCLNGEPSGRLTEHHAKYELNALFIILRHDVIFVQSVLRFIELRMCIGISMDWQMLWNWCWHVVYLVWHRRFCGSLIDWHSWYRADDFQFGVFHCGGNRTQNDVGNKCNKVVSIEWILKSVSKLLRGCDLSKQKRFLPLSKYADQWIWKERCCAIIWRFCVRENECVDYSF